MKHLNEGLLFGINEGFDIIALHKVVPNRLHELIHAENHALSRILQSRQREPSVETLHLAPELK